MRRFVLALIIAVASSAAFAAGFSMVQVINNGVPAGGFLLDGSAGFLTPDVPGNKIYAR